LYAFLLKSALRCRTISEAWDAWRYDSAHEFVASSRVHFTLRGENTEKGSRRIFSPFARCRYLLNPLVSDEKGVLPHRSTILSSLASTPPSRLSAPSDQGQQRICHDPYVFTLMRFAIFFQTHFVGFHHSRWQTPKGVGDNGSEASQLSAALFSPREEQRSTNFLVACLCVERTGTDAREREKTFFRPVRAGKAARSRFAL